MTDPQVDKLDKLTELEGFSDYQDLLEEFINESVVPGICMNKDCNCTYNYEPDQDKGWCDFCETNTVCSCMVLAGVI